MNKKQNRSRERCCCNAEEEEKCLCVLFTFLIRSQHCYIHFISTEDEKLGYVFYSTVTEFINCLTILTNSLTIIFSILFDRWLKQRWLKQSICYLDIPPQSYAWRNQA
ncbi:hypothetical protein Peur_032990 [Populus x canadensis]